MAERRKPEDVMAAVRAWQADSRVHPLTCGVDSQGHALLEPEIRDGSVILRCPTCGFVQTYLPDVVITAHPGQRIGPLVPPEET